MESDDEEEVVLYICRYIVNVESCVCSLVLRKDYIILCIVERRGRRRGRWCRWRRGGWGWRGNGRRGRFCKFIYIVYRNFFFLIFVFLYL